MFLSFSFHFLSLSFHAIMKTWYRYNLNTKSHKVAGNAKPTKKSKTEKKTNLLDTSWTQHWSTLEVACAQLGRSFHWNRSTLTTQSIVTWWHCVCLWVLRVEQNLKQVPDTTKLLCLNVHVTGSGRHAQKQAGWSAVATLLPRLWLAQGPRATCATSWTLLIGLSRLPLSALNWMGVGISVKYCEIRCSGILNRTVCWPFRMWQGPETRPVTKY